MTTYNTPIKVTGSEISVTTANTVNNANLVRAYAAGSTLVTIALADNTTIGTFTMPAGSVELIVKNYDEKISANAALLCAPVAWR